MAHAARFAALAFGLASATLLYASTPIGSLGTRAVRIIGQGSTDALAYQSSATAIGDVNGDGRADMAVPAPGTARGATAGVGAVYIFFGRDGALSNLNIANADIRISGSTLGSGTGLGQWVSGVGDVNNDGNLDFLIGRNSDFAAAGRAYLIFGKSAGQTFPATLDVNALANNGIELVGSANADFFGAGQMTGNGDVTGDGIDDLVLGAQGEGGLGNNSGAAYLIPGRALWTSPFVAASAAGVVRFGPELSGDQLGATTGIIPDINNDGRADVTVQAFAADFASSAQTNDGKLYVLFGRPSTTPWAALNVGNLSGVDGFQVRSNIGLAAFGFPHVGLGDFNGDGVNDFAAAAVLATPSSQSTIAVIFGKANWDPIFDISTLNGSNGIRLLGQAGEAAGAYMAAPGDLNGDGINDMLLSAPGADLPNLLNAGRVYAVYGSATTFAAGLNLSAVESTVAGEIFTGSTAGFAAGPLIEVGKFSNVDDLPDFVIGSETATGDAYLVYRSPNAGLIFANGFE